MIKILFIIFILISSGICQTDYNEFIFDLDSVESPFIIQWKYHSGDNSTWSLTEYCDSSWTTISPESFLHHTTGIQWYRAHIILKGKENDTNLLSVYIRALASAYEVYWDGNKIESNGSVSEKETDEICGETNRLLKLKQEWTKPGKHIIAIRLSNHLEQNFNRIFFTQIGYYSVINDGLNINYYKFFFSTGLFLLATLLSIALFLGGGQHRSYLLFAIFCFLNVLFPGLFFTRSYLSMNLLLLPYINMMILFIGPVAVIFFNIFFLYNFNIPKKTLHIIINVSILALILIFFSNLQIVFIPLYSIGLTFYAIKKKTPGSIEALLGVAIFTIMNILLSFNLVDFSYFISEIIFLFFITLSISRQIKEENRQLELTKLHSIRLEAELLKRHIQPHFLMNTLLSIISWIDEYPKKATALIKVLADEFRLINEISTKKEIPLEEEITLCKSHLELMSHRKDVKYEFICHNLCEDEMIPPMLFHTLIENGLTHSFNSHEDGVFELSCYKNESETHFKLQNNGSLLKKINWNPDDPPKEGMGLKYIRTRLEENYPGKWNITYGLNAGKWEVNIILSKVK